MPKINCSVENCSYNHNKYCCASVVNISGCNANMTESTCCATFLDTMGYENVQSSNVQNGAIEVDAILCDVQTCAYHREHHCTLEDIEVSCLAKPEVYTQTDCLSFERKNI